MKNKENKKRLEITGQESKAKKNILHTLSAAFPDVDFVASSTEKPLKMRKKAKKLKEEYQKERELKEQEKHCVDLTNPTIKG